MNPRRILPQKSVTQQEMWMIWMARRWQEARWKNPSCSIGPQVRRSSHLMVCWKANRLRESPNEVAVCLGKFLVASGKLRCSWSGFKGNRKILEREKQDDLSGGGCRSDLSRKASLDFRPVPITGGFYGSFFMWKLSKFKSIRARRHCFSENCGRSFFCVW